MHLDTTCLSSVNANLHELVRCLSVWHAHAVLSSVCMNGVSRVLLCTHCVMVCVCCVCTVCKSRAAASRVCLVRLVVWDPVHLDTACLSDVNAD